MAPTSEPDLLVLLGLRLKSLAPTEALVPLTDLAVDDIGDRLIRFEADGWVRHRDGVLTGWTLLPAGRAEASRAVVAERDQHGARDAIHAAYRRFFALNPRLLQVCTDWDLRAVDGGPDPIVNDHTDATYDARVIASLRDLDAQVQPICAELAASLDRFAGYGARLHVALERTEAGDTDWFTKPGLDSYHTVWFELHENLLTTLEIERGSEVSA